MTSGTELQRRESTCRRVLKTCECLRQVRGPHLARGVASASDWLAALYSLAPSLLVLQDFINGHQLKSRQAS